MALFILGLSHKTAPVEMREKVAFDPDQLPQALGALNSRAGVSESLILSTCNRTELYCDIEPAGSDAAMAWLADYRKLALPDIEPHLYHLDNEHAVRHTLRVASGLDSLILGEPQILGQLKQAYREAVGAGTAGKFLNRLMQFSFSTAKLVRSETEIGNTPVSVAYAAVKLAQQIHGQLNQRSALLIGAGDTISLVANHLAGAGIGKLVICNRTHDNAVTLARRYGGEAIEMSELPSRLADVDMVVSSTASRAAIVTRGMVELALERRRGEPLFIVDLAIPRDVETTVGELDDAYLYTVDDLEKVIASNLRLRHQAAQQAEEMVHLQVQDYMDWVQLQSSSATITAYRQRAEGQRDAALAQAMSRLERGEDPATVLQQFARGLTNKLMHEPTRSLRAASGNEDFVRVARELLGIGNEKPPQ